MEFQQKNPFEKIFQEMVHSTAILFLRFFKSHTSFCKKFLDFILRWKILKQITQVLSYVVCIQLKKHIKKKDTKNNMRRKGQDVLFLKKQVFQFCLLSVWDLLRLIPRVFWSENFTKHFLLCVFGCGQDLSLKFDRQYL